MCSPPWVKSLSITIQPHFTLSTLSPPPCRLVMLEIFYALTNMYECVCIHIAYSSSTHTCFFFHACYTHCFAPNYFHSTTDLESHSAWVHLDLPHFPRSGTAGHCCCISEFISAVPWWWILGCFQSFSTTGNDVINILLCHHFISCIACTASD